MSSPSRSPETCAHRQASFRAPDGNEYAHCMLLRDLSGLAAFESELYRVSRKACETCCRKRPPSKGEINSVVASLLHRLATAIVDAGGMPGCDKAKAAHLADWARDNLVRLPAAGQNKAALRSHETPCFYLGEQTGMKECLDCNGTVRLKSFHCHHEDHSETTYRDCTTCTDYDSNLAGQAVKNWAVGVTTAPRKEPTLERSLQSLRNAGWNDPYVFAEPDCSVPDLVDHKKLIRRNVCYGAWPNWYTAATELYMLNPHADAYLLCQDDTLYAKGLKDYLEKELWPATRLGVVSLHTASHRSRPDLQGFHPDNEGWRSWGAQCYAFPNASFRAMLRHPTIINHRHRGPADGMRNIDSVIGYWCTVSKLNYFIHQPSLTQHIGETSTLWAKDVTTAGKRRASNFVGEDTVISELLSSTTSPSCVSGGAG